MKDNAFADAGRPTWVSGNHLLTHGKDDRTIWAGKTDFEQLVSNENMRWMSVVIMEGKSCSWKFQNCTCYSEDSHRKSLSPTLPSTTPDQNQPMRSWSRGFVGHVSIVIITCMCCSASKSACVPLAVDVDNNFISNYNEAQSHDVFISRLSSHYQV